MNKDVKKYTPEEYVRLYKTLLKRLSSSKLDKIKATQDISREYAPSISDAQAKIKDIDSQYFLGKYGNASLYMNRIETFTTKIYFNEPYNITNEKGTRRVSYYRGKKLKWRTETYTFVRIASSRGIIDIQTGTRVSDAKSLVKILNGQIALNADKCAALDKSRAEAAAKLEDIENRKAKKISESNEKFSKQGDKYSEAIDHLLNNASTEQIKYLYKPCRTLLYTICGIIGSILIITCLGGITSFIENTIEYNFGYSLKAPEEVTVDCNLKYQPDNKYFYCSQQAYTVEANLTNNSTLASDGVNFGIEKDGDKYKKYIPLQIIDANTWMDEDINFNNTLDRYKEFTDGVEIFNTKLHRIMAAQTVKVSWSFSNADKALMRKVWSDWKREQESIARKKYEEEKKQKEEADRKAAEEAAKKAAEEEAKRLEEERKKSQSTPTTNYVAPPQNTAPTQNTAPAQNSAPDKNDANSNFEHGHCRDGLEVYGNPHTRGAGNVCYGHGGWDR